MPFVSTSTVRRFNRLHTRVLGVLDDDFLSRGRPLGASRLLFEIGDGTLVADLRDRLDLDSGYVSRLLRSLEADDLVSTTPDPTDSRRRFVSLTDAGRRERDELDRLSDRHVDDLLEPLAPRRRIELANVLDRARRLLVAATVTFEDVDPSTPEALFALRSYYGELDATFEGGFDPGEPGADGADYVRPRGRFVIVRIDDESDRPFATVGGCGAVTRLEPGVAEIKRMWIHPEMRGLGLAGRLLRHLEDAARSDGHRRVRLDTNDALLPAIEMYRTSGYAEIDRYNDNPYARLFFEKAL